MATAKQLAARRKFARIMKSGGFKKKSKRTTTTKKRKTIIKRRKTTKLSKTTKRKSMARRRSTRKVYRKSKSSFGSFLKGGLIGKAVAGVGAATLAGLVIGQVAPQFSGIARPLAAFAAGGPVGAVTSVMLDGGLGSIGSMFGLGATTTPEVGV